MTPIASYGTLGALLGTHRFACFLEDHRKDPELLDDIEKVQEPLTVFENQPDLLKDAERFREALSAG